MLQSEDGRVHFTHLKSMADSPKHYRASVEEGFETPTFFFNRLVHHLVLGGVEGKDYVVFDRGVEGIDYVVYDLTKTRSGKVWEAFKELHAGKCIYSRKEIDDNEPPERRGAAWEVFRKRHEGKDIYSRKEVEEASLIAAAVRTDPVVRELDLLEGESELMIDWDNHGVPFRSHLDKLGVAKRGPRAGRRHLWDLKGTRCAKPDKFYWDAKRLTYHGQLGTYEDAAKSIGLPPDDVFIVAVETKAPYDVVVYRYGPAQLEAGRIIVRGWLERLRMCLASDAWPGYTQCVVDMERLEAEKTAEQPLPLTLIMHDGSEVAA